MSNSEEGGIEETIASLFSRLPPHIDFMLHHQPHAIEQIAMGHEIGEISAIGAIGSFAPRDWVSPEQLQKAIATNSFWVARWMNPDFSGVSIRAAADPDVLLAALAAS